jgi:epidermal growth factor receptor substrate 15
MSSVTEAAPETLPTPTAEPAKNAFDDFDDFADLSEAKEADKTGSDFDFGFGRQSVDEFNPAFDSPAPSQSQTPTPMNRSVQQPTESNGFANFAPNVSTSSTSGFGSDSNSGSIQQTPQNVQHDWDAIFSGLDSSKDVDTSLGNSNDPWAAASSTATTNGNTTAKENSPIYAPPPGPPPGKTELPSLGRAISPGTEHDDPILKRLTGMGYPRSEALSALEKYDYDINKVRHVFNVQT